MKISTSTFAAFEALGIDGGMRAIKEAGFDAIDLGLDALFPTKDNMDDAYVDDLMDWKRIQATIDAVKAGFLGKSCGDGVEFRQTVQIIVCCDGAGLSGGLINFVFVHSQRVNALAAGVG